MIRSNRRNRRQPSPALAPSSVPVLFAPLGWSASGSGEANTQFVSFQPDAISVGIAEFSTIDPSRISIYGAPGSLLVDSWIQELTGVATLFALFSGSPFGAGASVSNLPWDEGMRGINGEWVAPSVSGFLLNGAPSPWMVPDEIIIEDGIDPPAQVGIEFESLDSPGTVVPVTNPPSVTMITKNGVPAISSQVVNGRLIVLFPTPAVDGDLIEIPRNIPGLLGTNGEANTAGGGIVYE